MLHSQQHPMLYQIMAYSKGSTNKPLTRDVMLEAIDKRGGTLLELGSTNKPLTRDVMLEAIDKRGGTLLELSLQHIG
ncbi:hypothetical protein C5167_034186 [Papaver somniferum]|uniref:Uncharacterized protein n=1 Tax=Papaver somniferum TaxID=3469 RepID=A0A4Y7KB89_PAPSO|nr:hypothetical protein C5167_034186 [Papaver somniferum]